MAAVGSKESPISFDRHTSDYIDKFVDIKNDLQARCPLGFSDTYDGHWVASGYRPVFELARASGLLSNDRDPLGQRKGYKGIGIPFIGGGDRTSFLEMDPPEQKDYRNALNPYLSPAAVARWKPMVEDLTRACLDEHIESGRIDFVDDLANVVPAVMTLALMGIPLLDWTIYNEPAHALFYTPNHSPDKERVLRDFNMVLVRLGGVIAESRKNPQPGLVNALVNADICGQKVDDEQIVGTLFLLIGGGFDTTTALTAHSLEWLSQNPGERERLRNDLPGLLDSATEEFLRFYAPAPGDGRTVTEDIEFDGMQLKEGDRIWVSWAMANRDPSMFPDPDVIKIDRTNNRHTTFGLGVHRCIGSNVARAVYKTMLTAVLDRMPNYVCDPAGTVHYDTIGVINGMKHLPATFTPGKRLGPTLDETIDHWQKKIIAEDLAAPIG